MSASYPPGPPGPPGYPPGYLPQQNSGKATTALVLGVVSLVACGLFTGIPAMVVARRAKREIAASEGRLAGEGLATAGFWTGLIGTVLSAIGVVLVLLVVVVAGTSSSFHCTSTDANGSHTVNCS